MSVVQIVKNKLDSLGVKTDIEQVLSWLPLLAEAVMGNSWDFVALRFAFLG